ncbi:amino acid permease [Ureibacillus thermophilus]|uniref:Amino acid permease n=1 Tax=Ureibacillus thermophilus TaxID=367743 RepID=A0A4P6UQB4_9BACL|nr:amino acid permease [Ureibacillus thermophilus]QBK24707.1 amino acid permease [Ureibacillus thermophilus]
MKENEKQLRRSLKSRHITMISLGGTIGTGLFLASGASVAQAGPGGALLAYALIGMMVYFLMTSLGEMAAYMPSSGSFSTYATNFVDPAFGFAMGWNYWYNWAITIAAEISAVNLIMKYWFPDSPSALWTILFIAVVLTFNLLSVNAYGESEYWFAMIKVATVIIFIIVSYLMVFGIIGGEQIGFTNFFIGDAPFNGGFLAIFGIFLAAGFSFQGTELLGITAGETEDPGKNIPKAVRSVFWRILLFYILAILAIGLLVPYTDSRLLSEDVAVSPFTLVFDKLGIAFAASIMNAIILTAMLSAGNSGLYASSRMLWQLAVDGKAPKMFTKLNRRGVPIYALLATLAIGCLAFLSSFFGDGIVYIWLLNASGLSGFIAWVGIAISHYRFRKAYIKQGRDLKDLPYKAPIYPFGSLFALILCLIVIIGQNYQAFIGTIDWHGIAVSYIGLPLFIMLWLGYKIKHKTKIIPLEECNLDVEKHK